MSSESQVQCPRKPMIDPMADAASSPAPSKALEIMQTPRSAPSIMRTIASSVNSTIGPEHQ